MVKYTIFVYILNTTGDNLSLIYIDITWADPCKQIDN